MLSAMRHLIMLVCLAICWCRASLMIRQYKTPCDKLIVMLAGPINVKFALSSAGLPSALTDFSKNSVLELLFIVFIEHRFLGNS